MLKRIVTGGLATLGIAFLINQAQAADLGRRPAYVPPAPPAPVYNWTGFYIGVNGGAGWGTSESTVNLATPAIPAFGIIVPPIAFAFPLSSHNVNGFLGGGQIGYNYQFNSWLVGIEGDGDWADIKGNGPCLAILNCTTKVKWTADITGRLGVLPTDRLLVYVKGGVSWANVDYSFGNAIAIGAPFPFAAAVSANQNLTKTGGLLGLGTEYAFAPNWTAKLEYNYADYGTQTNNFLVGAAATGIGAIAFNVPTQTDLKVHTIRAGINYKFW